MSKKYNHLEKEVEKKFTQKDKRKRPRMKVSGKKVFELQKLMQKSKGKRIQKITKKK